MELVGIAPMYRQHPHQGPHSNHQEHNYPQYQHSDHINGQRPMATHFEPPYPVYPHNNVAYPLPYQPGYDYVQPGTPQPLVPAYHHPSSAHHGMQAAPSMYPSVSLPPPLPLALPPTHTSIQSMRHDSAPLQSPTFRREHASPTRRYPTITRSASGSEQMDEGGSKTDVDTLMQAIQAKGDDVEMHSPLASPLVVQHPGGSHQTYPSEQDQNRKDRKRYQCTNEECGKHFYQKTHLEIHMRAHTGHKPFLCREPSCGQRFSQLGNLKTHERRHTGERPYACDACGKRFAQRGNVRAHRVVHEQFKPFTCKLDNCLKNFTQLGNLKSHQNKFHSRTIQELTAKFASCDSMDGQSQVDKDMWEYFSQLYKNCNRGIKGRGKDRRIAAASPESTRSDGTEQSSDRLHRRKNDRGLANHSNALPPMHGYGSAPSSISGGSDHDCVDG